MNFSLKFVYFTLFYYTFICIQKSLGDSVESTLNSIVESTHLLHENSTKNGTDKVLGNDLVNDPNIPNYDENFIESDLKISEIFPEQINGAAISQIPTAEPAVQSVTEIVNNDTPIVIASGTDPALDALEKRATIPINNNLIESSHFEDNINNETESIIANKSDFIEATNSTTVEEVEKVEPKLPSFVEWTQKRLEEVEKKEHNNNINNNLTVGGGNNSTTSSRPKMRWKNYAGVECGAKVILTNSEAQNTWAILDVHRDEYMLNPCTSRIWFVVELCEGIQLKKLELANFELFSSSPKQFLVLVSDRFPSRDWSTIGQFTASDENDVQHFEIETETFGKYVKIEIKSHYGEEHYCPLSLFRVYGASVFEVIQKEDPGHHQEEEDDDNADESLNNNLKKENPNTGGNLLSSATDAVLSMVKKAAEALGKKVNKTTISSQEEEEILNNCTLLMMNKPYCISPSYNIQCTSCPTELFDKIYDLLSCKFTAIDHLVNVPIIRNELENSIICEEFRVDFQRRFGGDFNNPATYSSSKLIIQQFFPQYFLGAMCNLLAANNGQASYNNSFEFPNITQKRNTNYNDNNNQAENNNYKPFNNSLNHELKMMEQINNNNNNMIHLKNNDKNSKKSGCLTDTTNLFVPTLNKPIKNLELPIADIAAINNNELDNNVNEENNAETEEPVLLEQSTEIPEEENLVAEYPNTGKDSSAANNSPVQGNVIQKGQRESVFLRLSNRIRVLELNMSLSGQYLEELSKRYTKQVEELQRALEKTVKSLQEVSNTKDERYQELETQLVGLKTVLDDLISEKNYWKTFALCFFLATLCIIIAYYKLYKRYSRNDGGSATSTTAAAASAINNKLQRRNSIDGMIRINRIITKNKKKRRPSDQALRIVGLANPVPVKKRRKRSGNCEDLKWIEDKVSRVIQQDVPYLLEENDSYAANDRMPLVIPPPVYMRTATDFRTSVRNNNVEDPNRKDNMMRQNSPTSSDDSGKNKEKKSFKKLLKRVF